MHYTDVQPDHPGDRARAAALLATICRVVAPYVDVRRAEADGFKPNFPGLVRQHYHFSRRDNFWTALSEFDPTRPTSLLYDRTADGSYHLTGVMYTAPRDASMAELDARVPLSIARWHQHLNICFAPTRDAALYAGDHPRFGNRGSIATRADCEVAGGRFLPQLLGWMVHIHPFAADPWAVEEM